MAAAAAVPEPQKPSPEQMAAQAQVVVQQQWSKFGDDERVKRAKAKGLLDKLGNITEAGAKALKKLDVEAEVGKSVMVSELRKLIPLAGDTIRYVKKDGVELLAHDRNGFPSFPRMRGRRHPHMTKHGQRIKSASIPIFKALFTKHRDELELQHMAVRNVAKTDEERAKIGDFLGVPEQDIVKLGARATTLALLQVNSNMRAKRARRRNMQKLSRRINFGLSPANTNVVRYIA